MKLLSSIHLKTTHIVEHGDRVKPPWYVLVLDGTDECEITVGVNDSDCVTDVSFPSLRH